MRPATEGCTEQSCIYHGYDNRVKASHSDGCPVRSYWHHVESVNVPDCECAAIGKEVIQRAEGIG